MGGAMESRVEGEVLGCFEMFSAWLKENEHYRNDGGIYSEALVMWLMTYQRLQEGASLSRAVDEFGEERFWKLAGDCKRTQERRVSTNTGGYAQARANLSVDRTAKASDELFLWLQNSSTNEKESRSIYSLDGTTLELLRNKELLRKYPPHPTNGHYPLMRLLVCHDLKTGLAIRPEDGAMYGKNRTGEIELSKKMFSRLPNDSVVVGDRNFGIFCISYCAKKAGIDVVLRLKDDRVKKVLGIKPKHGIDQQVTWTPTPQELDAHPEISSDAKVEGRVICMNVQSYRADKITPLYLFTTLKEPVDKVIEIYGLRWNIEIDLRTLKQTVNMTMLKVNSQNMALKELYMGICAYNLVRSVIQTAADKIGVKPRDLSFKRVLYAVQAYSGFYARASSLEHKQRVLARFAQTIESAKHPKRKRKRVEPRAVVRRPKQKFPALTTSRTTARKKLMKKTKWH
jgi:hypothetical protein